MVEILRRVIPWEPSDAGGPLGRHVQHDPRSLDYQHPAAEAASWTTRFWKRHVGVYDQGSIGDCTAEAICGALSTGRFTKRIRSQRTCRAVYHRETLIDGFGA